MRAYGTSRRRPAAAALGLLLLAGCAGEPGAGPGDGGSGGSAAPSAEPGAIPGVGGRLKADIPEDSRQVVAVYGKGRDSAAATVALYEKRADDTWRRERAWPAHNGKRGWTPDHREGDKRSPVGVFTLSDAGGVLPDPGAKLPYTHTDAFTAPRYWPKSHWHDFDLVIAIDYNRVRGTSPLDPTRPRGQKKGGSIWFHMDHGSGTSGCVSLSKAGMTYLLKSLDPKKDPVAVMGDRASLEG